MEPFRKTLPGECAGGNHVPGLSLGHDDDLGELAPEIQERVEFEGALRRAEARPREE